MSDRPARTAALIRAEVTGLVLAMAAILFGRADLLLLAAPMLLYAVCAEITRPREQPIRCLDDQRRLAVGADTTIEIDAAAPALLTVAAPTQHGVRPAGKAPRSAAGGGHVALAVTVASWGKVVLGPLVCLATDPLHAWRTTRAIPGPTLLAQPAARTIKAASTITSPIGAVGRHPSPRPGAGSNPAGIRPYQAGDRTNRINWRATGRTGSLHTNQTQLERDTDILIVLDTLTLTGTADAADSVDLGCEAASAIAHHYAWLGDRIALHDLGGRIPTLPFGTGRNQTRRLLDLLSRLDRNTSDKPTLPALRVRPHTLTFVCSPLLATHTLQTIDALHRAGNELAIVDTFPADLSSPPTGAGNALRIRALERGDDLRRLRQQGIPVSRWQGQAGLAPLLAGLAASRGPRRAHR